LALQIGDVLNNKYKIVRMIGHGGMGAVYEGENTAIARRVAIKVLLQLAAGQEGMVERFEREAQAAGRIGNDHILEVLDMGTLPDGERFMVMEYLDGDSLQDRIDRQGQLGAAEISPLARQLLTGLQAAHAAGIIHRDLKPDNVFILKEKAGRKDYIKIIDFGISKFTQLGGDMKMTATGAVMGTPYYMSPEQAKGVSAADARSDLYAVGVIIYRAVTGQVPFEGQTFNELLFKIVLSPLPNARDIVPDLDPAFDSIIAKAMARDAGDRFQTAGDFIAALQEWETTGKAVTVPPESTQESRTQSAVLGQTQGLQQKRAPKGTLIDTSREFAGISAPASSAHAGYDIAAHSAVSQSSPDAWSNTGMHVPKRSNTPLIAGGAIAALLVLGGLSFGAYSVLGGTAETPESSATAGTVAAREPSAEPAQTADPVEAREPTVAPVTSATAPPVSDEPAGGEDGSGDEAAAASATVAPTTAPRPVVRRPRPAPLPAPRPTPPSKRPGTGTPDFGY
jgi:serine/threonine-protein kinase